MLLLIFAAFDALAGAYLLGWALRREQRDKPGVAVVGGMLLLAAIALVVIGALRSPPPTPLEPPPPEPTGTNA